MSTLLSVDWDYFSGSLEHIFDSPLWGSPDLEFERCERWRERARARGGSSFEVLRQGFPLFGDPQALLRFVGIPTVAVSSHDAAYGLLESLNCSSVINLDSHHDLFSSSGDPGRVRPGNWAGLALEHGLIGFSYRVTLPSWTASSHHPFRRSCWCFHHLGPIRCMTRYSSSLRRVSTPIWRHP
jgi:hypothetical protein